MDSEIFERLPTTKLFFVTACTAGAVLAVMLYSTMKINKMETA